MFNNYSERLAGQVKDLTPSFWDFVRHPSNLPEFLNPLYRPSEEKKLYPLCSTLRPRLWSNYFCRWKGAIKVPFPDLEVKEFIESQQVTSPNLISRARQRIGQLLNEPSPSESPRIRNASSQQLTLADIQPAKPFQDLTRFIINDYHPV